MDFKNSTALDSAVLQQLFEEHTRPYRHEKLRVRVRYSRGADFSGTCFYRDGRIFINLGRHNRYPYTLGTHVARARGRRGRWWRELYLLTVPSAAELALFVYLHELYHYLVAVAGRSPRQKEAMCDRFATRVLVDRLRCPLRTRSGALPMRETWDFQDLHGFLLGVSARQPRAARKRMRRKNGN